MLPVTALCAFALCAAVSVTARAEIYAWVDAEGHMTLSDRSPPPGAQVLEVVSEPKSAPAPRSDPVRDSNDAQLQYLTQRVQQLERDVAAGGYDQPPPAIPQYAAPPVSYSYGCSYWADCGPWWSAPGYPAVFGVVVAPGRGFHRFHHSHRLRGVHFRHR